MTKSKLAVSCLLAVSILSPMCVNALTQQDAADIAAASQSAAALTAEQKRMAYVQLEKETAKIQLQIEQKISEISTDKMIQNVSFTLTVIGTAVVSFALFTKTYSPYGHWTDTYGFQDLGRISYAVLAGGVSAQTGMIAVGTSQNIKLNRDQIVILKLRLAELQTEFAKKIAALN